MRTLSEIATSLDTDKGPQGFDGAGVFFGHDYTATYEAMFAPFRLKPITLLELGVWSGGSMRLWAEAFPAGRIYGVDRDLHRITEPLPSNVSMWQGNAIDATFMQTVAAVAGGFDIIIDDASHEALEQTTALRILWRYVRKNGWYVIEDVPDGTWACMQAEWERIAGHSATIIPSLMAVRAIGFQC